MGSSNHHVRKAVVQALESLQRAGITHLRKPRRGGVAAAKSEAAASAPAPRTVVPPCKRPPDIKPVKPAATDPRQAALDEVAGQVAVCTRCQELARTRTQTVFGVGNPHAKLVFLGEAPGADEDRQGEPFVGAAGQLLNKMLAACGLKREEIYIMNILRCRPPGNRVPSPEEAANCREWLDAQLKIIQPRYLCCLGASAAKYLMDTSQTIGRLRGRVLDFQGMKVVCTYHPAYLLRSPDAKKPTWEDLQLLLATMGRDVPKHNT